MMNQPVRVVVDCSSNPTPNVEVVARIQADIVAMLSRGDTQGAMAEAERLQALQAMPGNVSIVPLDEEDLLQRALDFESAEARGVEDRRIERDALLAASDWTMLADVPGKDYEAWVEYRQALRDLDYRDPGVVWPEAP